ncbi:MAG: ECF transporter S component [Eggerthellaceae bacterium]|jgi:riboflavin transporter FmnP|nr:ECF transporter S component [Eggerthellaceae bacterium]MDR2716202.1 ECF transporter S component [Coriobacteriaceae bacterium]
MTSKKPEAHEAVEAAATTAAAQAAPEAPAPDSEAADLQFTNTNRWDTRQLVILALMCAISALLAFIEFPLLPAAPWLKYDASAMPAMVSGFAYGPVAGLVVGIIGSLVHAVLLGDYVGALMNIIIVTCFVVPAALVYKRMHTWKGAVIALVVGCITATLGALAANLVITPLYFGMPREAVVAMILPVLLPFNLIKAVLNSVLTLIVYKSISNLITPKKKQIKGR